MRRVTKPGACRRGSGQKIVIRHDAGSRSPQRTAAAIDIALLGHGCGETLPSLRRIPASYRLETNGERLYLPAYPNVWHPLRDESQPLDRRSEARNLPPRTPAFGLLRAAN